MKWIEMGYLHVSCHVSAIFLNNSHPNTPGYINWSAALFCRVCSCSRVNSSHWAMEVPMHERLQLINHVVNRVGSDRKLILLNITHNSKIWFECLKIGDLPLKDRLSQWEGDDGFHRVRFATSFQAPNLGSQSRNHPNNKLLNDYKDSKSFKGVLWWTMGSLALHITGVITNTQNWSTRHCFHPGFMNFQQWQVWENVPLKQKGRTLHR